MGQPGKPGWSYYPLVTLPRQLDIVWCRFPDNLGLTRPGPKARPALVRAVQLDRTGSRARIEVTYGTSNLKVETRGDIDLLLANATELARMGLSQPTRFDLDRTATLPWAEEFFVAREGYQTPIIGHLSAEGCAQLEAIKVYRRVLASHRSKG